jgi:tetratricopeptide (TPR) repeat protein
MKKYNITLFCILIYFSHNYTLYSQSLKSYIEKGDSAANITHDYNKALEYYIAASEIDPNNSAILNKISKTIVSVGDYLQASLRDVEDEYKFGDKIKEESLDSTEIKGAQIDNYEKALELADKAVKIDPQNAEGYVRRAIANARIALTKGIFSVASIVNKVKEDLEFAINLGNGGSEIQALAHYVLAKTHDEVSEKWAPARSIIGLGWGEIETALKEYSEAINLKSDVVRFYLDYAKALLEEDEEDMAIAMLEKVDTCNVMEPQDYNRINEAKQLLNSLK